LVEKLKLKKTLYLLW